MAIYTRVAVSDHKANLDRQAQRLQDYCAAQGWPVTRVEKDIGSGVNDEGPRLLKRLTEPEIGGIIVEPTERLTRFG